MKKIPIKLGFACLALLLASTLTLLSVFIERTGPELVQSGNLCGSTFNDPCYRPVLKGGIPFAYLYDTPVVSVEGRLSFFEDELLPTFFAIDIICYFSAILLIKLLASLCWAAKTRKS